MALAILNNVGNFRYFKSIEKSEGELTLTRCISKKRSLPDIVLVVKAHLIFILRNNCMVSES